MRHLTGPAKGALLLTFAYLWCAYVMIFDPARRFSAAAYDSPKDVMPIKAWGLTLLVLTAAHAALIIHRNRMALALVSSGFVTFFSVFGLAVLRSSMHSPNAGRLGVGLFAALASSHLALAIWPEPERP